MSPKHLTVRQSGRCKLRSSSRNPQEPRTTPPGPPRPFSQSETAFGMTSYETWRVLIPIDSEIPPRLNPSPWAGNEESARPFTREHNPRPISVVENPWWGRVNSLLSSRESSSEPPVKTAVRAKWTRKIFGTPRKFHVIRPVHLGDRFARACFHRHQWRER